MTSCVYLFLSPHLDDAVLSCGGVIRHLTGMRQHVVVATVFTADAPSDQAPSWLAQRNHRAWDLYESPFKVRRDEDANATRMLGADFSHLGFLDAMYRLDANGTPLYQKNTVGVSIHDLDYKREEPAIQTKFRELAEQYAGQPLYVFSPLTLGGHVDHLIVRNAVQAVWQEKHIIYYEDFPYASRPNVMKTWLDTEKQSGTWESFKVALSENEVIACVDSIACYSSQLHGLFPSWPERIQEILRARLSFLEGHRFPRNLAGSRHRMKDFIRKYIANVGGERLWSRDAAKKWQTLFSSDNTN
jgi:LmbE family N-acetylglucosaminyl deacetylase